VRKLKAGDVIYDDEEGNLGVINKDKFDGWWILDDSEKQRELRKVSSLQLDGLVNVIGIMIQSSQFNTSTELLLAHLVLELMKKIDKENK